MKARSPSTTCASPGESRLIRARPGYRPIIRIEESQLDAVRSQRAVFVLDRKNLTLDGIDLVVDVARLPSDQTALFSCTGASLTLRNCSDHDTEQSAIRLVRGRSRRAAACRSPTAYALRGPWYEVCAPRLASWPGTRTSRSRNPFCWEARDL